MHDTQLNIHMMFLHILIFKITLGNDDLATILLLPYFI